jgi:hypothetical protein
VFRLSFSLWSVASTQAVRNKVVYFISLFSFLLALFNRVFGFLLKLLSNLYTESSIVTELIYGERVVSSIKSSLVFVKFLRVKKEVRLLYFTRGGEGWVFKELLEVLFHVKYNYSLGTELLPILNP